MEQERLTIWKRQREGIKAVKQKGKHLGRLRLMISEDFEEIYMQWKQEKITSKKVKELLKMSPNTFYRQVKHYEEKRLK